MYFDTTCLQNNNAEIAGMFSLFIASILFGMSVSLFKLPHGGGTLEALHKP